MKLRIALGAVGVLLGLFGVFRLLTQVDAGDLMVLFIWLVAALVLHDGILSPAIIAVGIGVRKMVPRRARRALQGALISGALVTTIALPMIHRAYTLPPQKAILRQDFTANLGILLAVIAAAAVVVYVSLLVRDRSAGHGVRAAPKPSDVESKRSE